MTLIDKAEALALIERKVGRDHPALADELRHAIRALPARGVGVKPLVWENFDAWTYWAKSPIGTYRVTERNGVWKATRDTNTGGELVYEYTTDGLTPDDFQAAQIAAQADYEARILAALEPAPAPTDAAQARAAALREAAAIALRHRSKVQINEELWHEGQDWAAERIAEAILALIGGSK